MLISISARHGHLSEETQAKIRTKTEKLVRIFERLSAIEVMVDLADERHPSAEILVSAEHKHDFVAAAKADSLWNAIDDVLHKIEQQVRKYKEKVQEHNRTPARGERTSETLPEPPTT